MSEHAFCVRVLVGNALALGAKVDVFTEKPSGRSPYDTDTFVCPHGQRYWIRPSAEQIGKWTQERTP